MDLFEDEIPQPPQKPGHNLAWLWNLMTIVIMVGMIAVILVVFQIYTNPASSINPFPMPTMVPTIYIPTTQPIAVMRFTPTITATQPLATLPPTSTYTATPTAINATPASPADQPTAKTPTPKVNSIFSFALQSEPSAINSNLFPTGHGCDWMGVAGHIFDMKNDPIALGIIVQVAGVIDGKVLNVTTLSGTARQYGDSGYEVTLADKPVASNGAVWVRLLDQAGFAISDKVYFDTSSDCTKNLVMVNFKQIK